MSVLGICVALFIFEGIYSQNIENHVIYKRESVNITVYTVDLLMVVDYSIYKHWINEYQTEDVDDLIRSHYGNVVNEMNARYSSVKGQFSIEIAMSEILILKNKTESLWIEQFHKGDTLNATRTLTNFREWRQNTGGLPQHDHAMLFTWYDLYKDGSDSVAGLAYTGTMCTGSSVSIVEDRVYGQTFHVAAHELAHSLGSRHDGSTNECSSEDNYIMADTKKVSGNVHSNRNSWKFSECTSEYFSAFIKELNEVGNNCLIGRTGSRNNTIITNPSAVTTFAPSPDAQCEMMQGNSSHLCRHFYKRNYTDFCALMFCSSKDERTCQFRLPVDGTPCGYNKKCYEGYCVGEAEASDANDAKYTDDCIFGDQPGAVYETNKGCPDIMKVEPYKCYEEDYALRCCQTCNTLHSSRNGCEYGDKEPMCKTVTRFHCFMHADVCCEFCKDFSSFIIKVIIPTGIGLLLLTTVLCLYCRYCCNRRKCAKKKTEETSSQDDKDSVNNKKPEHEGSTVSAMNGFRAPGQRHQPMFQYDRVAQLAALTNNQHMMNNLNPYGGIHNNGFINDFNRNPTMMNRNNQGFSRSLSMDRYAGNDYIPENDVIMQSLTPARYNFDLKKFGEGPYSWSIG